MMFLLSSDQKIPQMKQMMPQMERLLTQMKWKLPYENSHVYIVLQLAFKHRVIPRFWNNPQLCRITSYVSFSSRQQ